MLVCKVCNSEFVYTGSRGKNYQAKTCSKACRGKLTSAIGEKRRIHPKIISMCEICGKEIINAKSCSKACSAKMLSKKYAGRKITGEWLEKINESKKRENVVKFGNFICEKCKKVFETNLSLRSHKSYCTPGAPRDASCAACNKIFSERGLKQHIKSHDAENRKKINDKLRIAAQERCIQKTSQSELRFMECLISFFGAENVVHKFKIPGISHEYDFYIPQKNLIVEFDGDFWHGNPEIYELSPRMKRQYHIDRTWGEKATKCGYNIVRIWESKAMTFNLETL